MSGNGIFKIITWSMTVVFYIISAICLYKIGKRREIRHSWAVWIPYFGEYWMLGNIADHYDRWRTGKDHRFRIWMLVCAFVGAVYMFVLLYYSYWVTKAALDAPSVDMIAGLTWWLVVLIVLLIAEMAICVVYGFALHRTYYSCRPKRAVLMMVMSFVFAFFGIGPIICLLCSYKKDEGFDEAEIVDPEAEKKRLELYN